MRTKLLFLLLACSLTFPVKAQGYQPTEANLKARQEFRDKKFGIFLHWGLYAMLATGEWTMTNKDLNYKEYAKLAGGFYPSKFDAARWVAAIKASGAKYITFTSRHHEGFSMFDTKYSDYNIVDATPFKRDVLKELADECHKQGIGLHLYYSHIDWYREDAVWGRTGRGTGRPYPEGNWDSYYAFMNHQLTELLTNYGPIGAIWFDGMWDQDQNPDFDWELDKQYALIHQLQPSLPLETCQTMNGMWGYKITDQNYKSAKELIQYLVGAAVKDANLLMNIGPQPDGELPEVAVQRLAEMGEWMKVYGETIYGTRGGCVAPHSWGGTTQKGNKLYVHILDLKDKALFLPLIGQKVKRASYFVDGTPVKYQKNREGYTLLLREVPADIDTVIELELD